jgi:ribonuclease HII
LVPARREVLAKRIRERAVAFATAAADAIEIDRINIYQASRLAMKRAVEKLSPPCDYVLIDALKLDVAIPQQSIIHGDALSQCIAAASIVAKVHRDRCMREWDRIFPQYGLARNKGYSAPEHLKALQEFGPAPLHRFSFEPVRANSQYEFWSGYEQMELFGEDPAAAALAEGAW